MAMTRLTYQLLKEHRHILPRGGSLLEIGEANWYGDAPASMLLDDADCEEFAEIVRDANQQQDLFALAKAAYAIVFRPSSVNAIDINGTSRAMKLDLNVSISVREGDEHDVVINNGTLEHVFNIGTALRSMHNLCKPGGIIIHDAPFTGWIDHGFYTLQPTLFYDLAHANNYELISIHITGLFREKAIKVESREHFHALKDIPDNSQLFVVMRKVFDQPFRVPMQGVYDGRLSEAGNQAWQERR